MFSILFPFIPSCQGLTHLLAGCEFCGELSDFVKNDLRRFYPNLAPLVRILLLHRGPNVPLAGPKGFKDSALYNDVQYMLLRFSLFLYRLFFMFQWFGFYMFLLSTWFFLWVSSSFFVVLRCQSSQVLPSFSKDLQVAALETLTKQGIEVITNAAVTKVILLWLGGYGSRKGTQKTLLVKGKIDPFTCGP